MLHLCSNRISREYPREDAPGREQLCDFREYLHLLGLVCASPAGAGKDLKHPEIIWLEEALITWLIKGSVWLVACSDVTAPFKPLSLR